MLFSQFPTSVEQIEPTRWETFQPYFVELQERPLTPATIRQWLADWSRLQALFEEAGALIYIHKSQDTADKEKEQAFLDFINHVIPPAKVAEQNLKQRFLALDPVAYGLQDLGKIWRDLANDAALFREESIPLITQIAELSNEYDKVTGGMSAEWGGEAKNLSQLDALLQQKDQAVREQAWLTMHGLWLAARPRLNEIYADLLKLRHQVALNAGLLDYRAYAFQQYRRFDYTPEDCLTFHEAIATVVVPAAQRIYEKKRARLGVETLRPWDVLVDASSALPLRPYQGQDALVQGSLDMFHRVDGELGRQFAAMAEEELLDLETRAGKAMGGYCSTLPLRKRPFIFMNGVGQHGDVQTMLHEAGHAFHVFETAHLPLIWQAEPPMEFCEVASMSMELLAAPYLTKDQGGFYTAEEAARARIEHLEGIITFWPYMAVVDAFQHWVYTHPEEAASGANCDAAWDALWQRFMPGANWAGYEAMRETGWHRKLHIFEIPFYYVEYGIAQVGAVQVWRNSLVDQATAVKNYRHALSLGSTVPLPQLFAAAGAEFRFDEPMLRELVALLEGTIARLEGETAV